jgi:hypothetical protein
MPESLDLRAAPAGSAEWWLARLLARLEARRPDLETFEAYYDGHQPLAFASQKFRDAFGARFREFSSNFMSLVVDAPGERLEVQGFRFGDAEGDEDLWRRVWQANDLDAGSQLAHTEALMKGVAYALVEPQVDGVPVVTIEDALDCIVQHARGDGDEEAQPLGHRCHGGGIALPRRHRTHGQHGQRQAGGDMHARLSALHPPKAV